MTGTRLGQVPGVDAAAERPVALALSFHLGLGPMQRA